MPLDIFGPASAPNSVIVRPGETRSFSAADTFFKDCSSPELDDGTEVQSAWLNQMLAVLRAFARANGQTAVGAANIVVEDNADDAILIKAAQHLIQRGQVKYAVDSGTANNMIVALTPVPAELKAGMEIRVKAAASPTGATVLNLNSHGNKPVLKSGGLPLSGMEFLAGDIIGMVFDGFSWLLQGFSTPTTKLTANKTIYVNGAIGNDANDGLSNTVGHALATLQGAVNLAWSYAPSQYNITVEVAAGTYGGCQTPLYPGPTIIINGASAASVIVSVATGSYPFLVQGPNKMRVQNVTAQSGGSGFQPALFTVAYGATLETSNTVSGAAGGSIFHAMGNGTLLPSGPHTVNGTADALFYVHSGGSLTLVQGVAFTIGAAVTMRVATAWSGGAGSILVPSTSAPTFANPGNVTGSRYYCNLNGVVAISGNGANYFPGSGAGSTANGGQYA